MGFTGQIRSPTSGAGRGPHKSWVTGLVGRRSDRATREEIIETLTKFRFAGLHIK